MKGNQTNCLTYLILIIKDSWVFHNYRDRIRKGSEVGCLSGFDGDDIVGVILHSVHLHFTCDDDGYLGRNLVKVSEFIITGYVSFHSNLGIICSQKGWFKVAHEPSAFHI